MKRYKVFWTDINQNEVCAEVPAHDEYGAKDFAANEYGIHLSEITGIELLGDW